jgi:uncharacterized protein YecE (DUF72 family)
MPAPGALRIGCCGFPLSFTRYAALFSVVEVQQTFYQPPLARTLEKWRSQVYPEFEFTLKAWQLITHEASSPTYRRLREKLTDREKREAGAFRLSTTVWKAWERTLECARLLGSRAILFQCPARFTPTPENKNRLRAFFREIRPSAHPPLVEGPLTFIWEPRGDWRPEEVRELCDELGLVQGGDPFVQTLPKRGLGYFRLHGRTGYRYRYTDADLAELLRLARPHAPCYVFFNNISMLEDARRFLNLASSA